VAGPYRFCSAIRLRESIYAYPGTDRSVRYLALDVGVGGVGARAVGVDREGQHELKQETAHRRWIKITIRIRSLLEDFARINDRELSTLSSCRVYKLLHMLRMESCIGSFRHLGCWILFFQSGRLRIRFFLLVLSVLLVDHRTLFRVLSAI
jgi:hypothetical protein